MPTSLPELYTIDHLHDHYGISRDTLYDWLQSGELKGLKLGRVWHVTPDDWAAFLESRRDLGRRRPRRAGAADAPTTPARRRGRS